MSIPKLAVCSHVELARLRPTCRYVVISITDPKPLAKAVKIVQHEPYLVDELHLAFLSFAPDGPGADMELALLGGKTVKDLAFNPEHARKVWHFFRSVRDSSAQVIVACPSGLDRGPSVAVALADAAGLDRAQDVSGVEHLDYIANPHVYAMILGAAGVTVPVTFPGRCERQLFRGYPCTRLTRSAS